MAPDLWLIVLYTFGLLVALGATSGVVNHLLWLAPREVRENLR